MHWTTDYECKIITFYPKCHPTDNLQRVHPVKKKDTVKSSFLYILSEYVLTRYKKHSIHGPSPVRQPYIFEAGQPSMTQISGL
jgi:hypothetical protein